MKKEKNKAKDLITVILCLGNKLMQKSAINGRKLIKANKFI